MSTGPAGVTNGLLLAFGEQEKSLPATAPSSLCPHCHSTKPLHPQLDKSEETGKKGNSSSATDSNNEDDDDDYNNDQVGDTDEGLQLAKRHQLSPHDGPLLKQNCKVHCQVPLAFYEAHQI